MYIILLGNLTDNDVLQMEQLKRRIGRRLWQRARADKAIDHVPGWHSTSCAARGVANIQRSWESLQIRCHIRPTLSLPPLPPFDTGEPARRGTSKRARSRALSGSANPSSHPPSKEVLIGLYLDDSFYHRFELSVTPRTQEEDQCRLFQSGMVNRSTVLDECWLHITLAIQ